MDTNDSANQRVTRESGRSIRRRRLIAGAILIAGGAIAARPFAPVVKAIAASTQLSPAMSGQSTQSAAAIRVPGAWTLTSLLQFARSGPAAVVLFSGQVLVAGGVNALAQPVGQSELIDPISGATSLTGIEATPRVNANIVRLYNGKVLRVGGRDGSNLTLKTAELYDPATGLWSATGSLTNGRWLATILTLHDGKILIFGGINGFGLGASLVTSAEIYDPAFETWSAAGTINAGRNQPSFVLLTANGKLLVVGGGSTATIPSPPLGTAEVFDPVGRTWTPTPVLATPRSGFTLKLLPSNGKVVVAGGANAGGTVLNTVEIYDPVANTWALSPNLMTSPRNLHSAIELAATGKLLVVGGLTGPGNGFATNTAELYDPIADTWTSGIGTIFGARSSFTLTNLAGQGVVLAHGGLDATGAPIAFSGGLYDPHTGTWALTGSLHVARNFSTVVTLPDQSILRIGGKDTSGAPLASAEIYLEQLLAPNGWTATGPMANVRSQFSMLTLADGRTLAAGGLQSGPQIPAAELYNEKLGTWTTTGPLNSARSSFSMTRLPNGKVLATGGTGISLTAMSSVEIYNPTTALWSTAAPMSTARSGHNAEVLSFNGKVLVVGGGTSSAEIYDWAGTGLWSGAGSMNVARTWFIMRNLDTGQILVAGGLTGSLNSTATALADLYDPATNSWTATAPLNVARSHARSAFLSNGKVMVAGGFDVNGVALDSIEIYDPVAKSWSAGGHLSSGRASLTLTSLPNGAFLAAGGLVAGGLVGFGVKASDLFDENKIGTFPTDALLTARGDHASSLLPNGKVLAAGGTDSSGASLASAELYQEHLNVVFLPVVMNH